MQMLDQLSLVTGENVINQLRQISANLKGMKVVHVNSTRVGGGVAEILTKLIPLKKELGIDTSWEVIEGTNDFFVCTKGFHNALQGQQVELSDHLLDAYVNVNKTNLEKLEPILSGADMVFIHDPQPAPLLSLLGNRKGKWIWRCHIDISHPFRSVWKFLRKFIEPYDASIFSLPDFAQPMPHPQYIIAPSIDPLSEKNIELTFNEIETVCNAYKIDHNRPIITQVSRFDKFKDPVGVIKAYRLAKKYIPAIQLILAGGEATDDPEGKLMLDEVQKFANNDTDIKILLLPPDANRTINALQRVSDIVMQKSTKEGFGLTVTEALWKSKPVIGGDTGGIRLQVINYHTGFLVKTPEGAALRIRYMLNHRDKLKEMGIKGKEFVRQNFLLTRHLREYLTLMLLVMRGGKDRVEIT